LEKDLEEMGTQFKRMNKKVDKENRAKKDLETFAKNQEEQWGIGVSSLRKNLLQHINDVNVWKQFLEQNDIYKIDLDTLPKDSIVSAQPYPGQVSSLDQALQEEHERFRGMLDEKSKTTRAVEALEEEEKIRSMKKKKGKGKKGKN